MIKLLIGYWLPSWAKLLPRERSSGSGDGPADRPARRSTPVDSRPPWHSPHTCFGTHQIAAVIRDTLWKVKSISIVHNHHKKCSINNIVVSFYWLINMVKLLATYWFDSGPVQRPMEATSLELSGDLFLLNLVGGARHGKFPPCSTQPGLCFPPPPLTCVT